MILNFAHTGINNWLSSSQEVSLLTNGVVGESAANAYLQVQNADGSQYNHDVSSGNWTLEMWYKAPVNLTDQWGTYSSNSAVIALNNMINNFFNLVSSTGYWFNYYQTAFSTAYYVPIPYTSGASFRNNVHFLVTYQQTSPGVYKTYLYINGVPVSIDASTTSASAPTSLRFQYMTDRVFGGRFSNVQILGTRFYSRTLSMTEVKQTYNHGNWSAPIGSGCVFDFRFRNRTGNSFADDNGGSLKITGINFTNIANNLVTPTANTPQIRIICDGNSLTFGSGKSSDLKAYPFQLITLLGNPQTYEAVYNLGIASQTTSQIVAQFPNIQAHLKDNSKSKNIYVAWECTNQLANGGTVNDCYNTYVTLCGLARSAGFYVVAMTVLPRNNAGTPVTFEADRQSLNTLIRSNYATFSDAIVDVGADATIGVAGAYNNATYYNADLVHLTDAGYGVVAGLVRTAILSIP